MDEKDHLIEESELEGLITDFVYESMVSEYKVCELQIDNGDTVTVVGTMPNVKIGEHLRARGCWSEHPVYGTQFNVRFFENTLPRTREAIENYLGSGALKGIGPSLAHRIMEQFGEEVLTILENEPERLAEVRGISMKMAIEFGVQFQEQYVLQETIMTLQQFGITPALATRLYQQYKEKTVQVVRQNPYLLADQIRGIGFRRADAIAEAVGIEPNSPERIKAAIRYSLSLGSEEGHTYLIQEQIENKVYELTGIDYADMDSLLLDLAMKGIITQKGEEGEKRVYLAALYRAELNVASHLADLMEFSPPAAESLEKTIDRLQEKAGIELEKHQRQAIEAAMKEGVLIITGGPGTGKTTIVNFLLDLLEQNDEEYLLCAPTGRAAKRLTEATGREAKTIHRLLELEGDAESARQVFHRNKENPLEADMIIVDEVSMVDMVLMSSLMDAILPGTRLVLAGDKDQLPSVGPGSVLKDMIDSDCVPVVRLEMIFRQQQESDIVLNAHRILHGEYPRYNAKGSDFFLIRPGEDPAEELIGLVKQRLPKYLHCSPIDDIQVLSPARKGTYGVETLNRLLQKALNPPSKSKKELEYRQTLFREGDKVMQIRNDYNLAWKVVNAHGYALDEGTGVFNGDIGRIVEILPSTKGIRVCFDDGHLVEYEYASLEELELAYCITIHKAQGSESPAVVMALLGGSYRLYCRNLLYTGITRARKLSVILGDPRTVAQMVDNDRPMMRNSSLKKRLREIFGEMDLEPIAEGKLHESAVQYKINDIETEDDVFFDN